MRSAGLVTRSWQDGGHIIIELFVCLLVGCLLPVGCGKFGHLRVV